MAIGLGSTVEELVKEINSKDVTSAGNNKFTGNNTFTKGIAVYGSNSPPLPNTLYKVDKDGFVVITGSGLFNYNKVKFKLDPTATTAKEYTIATNEDLDKKQPTLVSGTNIKTINGQSILGEGDLEISGGGGSSGSVDLEPIVKGQHKLNKGEQLTIQQGYTYFVQCFDTSDNIAEFEIVGGNRNGEKGKFVMLLSGQGDNLAILQTGSIVISNLIKTAVRVEAIKPASNSSYLAYYEISGYASSTKTLNVGGGSPDSNEPVLISVASTNSYRIDPLDQLSQHNIRVRVISGTLQVGDRLEICRPIAKKAYNRVNGMQTNIRYRQKLKACAYKILTETDIANIATGKNILVLTVNHSTDQPNKGLKYTCTSNNSTFRGSAPRVIRIVRPTPYGQNGIMQNIQISNSVYVTRSYGSNVIKGM